MRPLACFLAVSLGSACGARSQLPVDVPPIIIVSAGADGTCAVTQIGRVKCWGYNDRGQLGDGSTTDSPVPVDVAGLSSGARDVSTEGYHTCAVTQSGGVECWGLGVFGELGDGSTTDSSTTVDVVSLSPRVLAVSAGGNHTCAVASAGGVECWGLNERGQLGDGSATDSPVPVDVAGLSSGVRDVSAGLAHTCAVTSAGGVECWGLDGTGQLGDGSTTDSFVPVDVVSLSSGVLAVSAGSTHTCAVTRSGGVKCWGYNDMGQLGDGSTTDSPVPVDVAGLSSGALAVSAGFRHTCALTRSGGVECWGYNGMGQLGDGSTTDSPVPVEVMGL
jgi:alpha-tubulin suppressor-like RCC1 family protein